MRAYDCSSSCWQRCRSADYGTLTAADKPRVIVTTDGEIDDECSMVRFLLYANECDVEGIVTSSSQYHWQGHKWAGDDWVQPYLKAYAEVYPNLIQHDPGYPTPEFLQSRTCPGNVKAEGDMDEETAGSERIVEVLLDESDPIDRSGCRPGAGPTRSRRAEDHRGKHPEKMAEVAKKIRFYFIWEQDDTYQRYIRPRWGRLGIPTIISDQFIAIAYDHQKKCLPAEMQATSPRMDEPEHPARPRAAARVVQSTRGTRIRWASSGPRATRRRFCTSIPTGLRSMESPGWGGWGGRFVRVRDNTWLDPVWSRATSIPKADGIRVRPGGARAEEGNPERRRTRPHISNPSGAGSTRYRMTLQHGPTGV